MAPTCGLASVTGALLWLLLCSMCLMLLAWSRGDDLGDCRRPHLASIGNTFSVRTGNALRLSPAAVITEQPAQQGALSGPQQLECNELPMVS